MRPLHPLLVWGSVSLAVACGSRTDMWTPIVRGGEGGSATGGSAGAAGTGGMAGMPNMGGMAGMPNVGGVAGMPNAGGGYGAYGGYGAGGGIAGAYPGYGGYGAYGGVAGVYPASGGYAGVGAGYPATGGYAGVAGMGAFPGYGGAGGSTSTPTCASICSMILTKCPRSDKMCAQECQDQRVLYPECNGYEDAFILCLDKNGVICGAGGTVIAPACTAEMDAMDNCVTGVPVAPSQCAAFPPRPPNTSCSGGGTAGGAGGPSAGMCTSTCSGSNNVWSSTCQGGKCVCAFNGAFVCSCANVPGSCASCCPGMF